MKISAVIPAYNSAKFIRAAISSIQAQTSKVDEIIVVDDGSMDDTEQIVKDISHAIIYHKQLNQGPSAARNKGIELASGDWIAFLDADDQWTPDKIAKQIQTLQAHPELHLIAGDMTEIDNDDLLITNSVLAKHQMLASFQHLAGKPVPNALAALVMKNFIPTGTVLVKRHTLIETGMFNAEIRFGEDLELWAKIAACHPITCLPDILMLRRQHGNNATQASEAMLINLTKVMDSICDFAAPQLINQGVSPDNLVAEAQWTLGYWYFNGGDNAKARQAFSKSLSQKFKLGTLLYFISSSLPAPLIDTLRVIKQKFAKP
ncbi:Glycosyl transferase [Methylomonas albis]|uniref:Glycosyltransferase family 2 protein n=1 Tax=Methylomonas albis TaxID=1854563 RepID=A0ABR9CY15_9GAMM|nr:glycosyltransferase family A protein [Methylomonas albis]MBD9355771.1 glycosyltransferase family 2 protein [Methylomonas albis]CAD6878792.1 Glycosyl transferase [Methylomonas albis]